MVSDSYHRNRRLAYIIVALSVALLIAGYRLGFLLETFSHPRILITPRGLSIIHQVNSLEVDESKSVHISVNSDLSGGTRLKLAGACRAAVGDGDETRLYFNARQVVLKDNRVVREAEETDLPWPVLAAAREETSRAVWIFGVVGQKIVARRYAQDGSSESATISETGGEAENLIALTHPETGLALVWRIKGTTTLKSIVRREESFHPFTEMSTGDSPYYAVALAGKRLILVTHRREDRQYGRIRLRLSCCPNCGEAPPPSLVAFDDPILLGRKVTGLAAHWTEQGLAIALTRSMTVQVGLLSPKTLDVPPGTRLRPVLSEPLWRRTVSQVWPLFLLFFASALVSLGFVLFRERRRPAVQDSPPAATRLHRTTGHLIDLMILPVLFFSGAEGLNLLPDTRATEWTDPMGFRILFSLAAFQLALLTLQESLWSRTMGKLMVGIRVADARGKHPGLRRILIRNLVRLLDGTGPLLVVGAAFMLFSRRRRRLGDLIAGTLVVESDLFANKSG